MAWASLGDLLIVKVRQIVDLCRRKTICRMNLPHQPTATISAAARSLGVNRRTVQRWVKAQKVRQYPSGQIDVDDCVSQMARRRVGRKSKGTLWQNPLFWAVKGTPSAELAEPFLADEKLESLQAMLAIVAFWHAQRGSVPLFTAALGRVISLAEEMEQKRRHGDISWRIAPRKFIEGRRG